MVRAAVSFIRAKGVTEPAGTPEHGFEQFGFAEAEAAEPELFRKPFEIDPRVVLGHHKDQAAILVDEEEVLGVRARDRGAQGCRLLDGKHGLVLDRGRFDAELFKLGE
jgi:hypothetical protein